MDDYTGRRARCPRDGRTFSLTWDGRYRKHGPVGFECPESGRVADASNLIPVAPPAPERKLMRSPVPWISDERWDAVQRACREADRRGNVGTETRPPIRFGVT